MHLSKICPSITKQLILTKGIYFARGNSSLVNRELHTSSWNIIRKYQRYNLFFNWNVVKVPFLYNHLVIINKNRCNASLGYNIFIPHTTSWGGYNVFDPLVSQSVSQSVRQSCFFYQRNLLWNLSTEFRETLYLWRT